MSTVSQRLKSTWPAIAISVFLIAVVGLLVREGLAKTGGTFIYPLDDTYIHMAMAKNFAQDGVWGVTAHEFSSSSSSPLWTLLISLGFAVFGFNDWIPLALTVLAGILFLFSGNHLLLDSATGPVRAFVLLAVLLLGAVSTLAYTGLEHVLHAAVTLLFVGGGARLVVAGDVRAKRVASLVALAVLLGGTRYEGLFLVVTVAVAAAVRRRFAIALVLLAAGILPVAVYGAVSVAHGWFWLPNSVLLKGAMPDFSSAAAILDAVGGRALRELAAQPHLLALLVIALLAASVRLSSPSRKPDVPGLQWLFFACAILFHLQFARVGWLYRYEGYLVAVGLVLAGAEFIELVTGAAGEGKPKFLRVPLLITLAAVVLAPFYVRATDALKDSTLASQNIYDQQYQMARFLQEHYPDQPLVANDIGAMNYFGKTRVIDFMGLATLETARLRLDGVHSAAALERIANEKGARIAVAYESWLVAECGVPPSWKLVGDWLINNNVVCGSPIVSFYATRPEEVGKLRAAFNAYREKLPEEVAARDFLGH